MNIFVLVAQKIGKNVQQEEKSALNGAKQEKREKRGVQNPCTVKNPNAF